MEENNNEKDIKFTYDGQKQNEIEIHSDKLNEGIIFGVFFGILGLFIGVFKFPSGCNARRTFVTGWVYGEIINLAIILLAISVIYFVVLGKSGII